MHHLICLSSLALVVGWTSLVTAEEIAKPASAPASQAAPTPSPAPPPPSPPPPPPPPPPSPPPAPAATPPKSDVPPNLTLLRVDIEDGFAIHPWLYYEHRLSKRWGILGDVHAQTPGRNDRFPPYIEIDVGPVLHVGPLQINPQIGVDFAWKPQPDGGGYTRASDFIFQLYLICTVGRINAESWNLYFIPFDSAEPQFYLMRQLVDVRVAWQLSLGPHVEGTFIRGSGTDRIAIGGDLSYAFSFGALRLFLAAERMRGVLETRLTFIREL